MSIRLITTADNHLGRYYGRMPGRVLEERRQRIREAFARPLDYAIETRADMVLLAGDLFDTPNPRNPERVHLARKLRELGRASIPVVAIGGNHDAPRSSTEEGGHLPLAVYHELEALHFFGAMNEDRVLHPIVFNLKGYRVAVAGITPNTNLRPDDDPLEGVTFPDMEADLRVLLVHAGIEGTMYEGGEAMIKRAKVDSLENVDILVAGNVHRYDSFKIGQTQVVIPGATEWMDFGEARSFTPGFAEIEISSGKQINVRHIRTNPQPRAEIRVNVAELETDDPTLTVLIRLNEYANKDALAKLIIEGTLDRERYTRLNFSAIDEHARESFFFCDIDMSGLTLEFEDRQVPASSLRRSISDEINQVIDYLSSQDVSADERAGYDLTREALLAELEQIEQ